MSLKSKLTYNGGGMSKHNITYLYKSNNSCINQKVKCQLHVEGFNDYKWVQIHLLRYYNLWNTALLIAQKGQLFASF